MTTTVIWLLLPIVIIAIVVNYYYYLARDDIGALKKTVASELDTIQSDVGALRASVDNLQTTDTVPYNVKTDLDGTVTTYLIDVRQTGTWLNHVIAKKTKYQSLHIIFNTGIFSLDTDVQIVDQSFVKISGQGHGFISGVEKNFANVYGGLTVLQVSANVTTAAFSFASKEADASRITGIHLRDFTISGPSTSTWLQHGVLFVSDNDACSVESVTIAGINGVGVYNIGGDAFKVHHCQINELGSGVALLNCIHCSVNDNMLGAQPIARQTVINNVSYPSGFDGLLGKDVYISKCEYTLINDNLLYPDGWVIVHVIDSYNTVVTGNAIESYFVGAAILQRCTGVTLTSNVIRVPGDRHTNTDISTIGRDVVNRDASFGIVTLFSCNACLMNSNVVYCPQSCRRILNLTGGNNTQHAICANQFVNATSSQTINIEGDNNAQCIVYDNLRAKSLYYDQSQDQSTLYR